MTNQELAQAILELTGPASNIIQATNCMTRLRLQLKEQSYDKDKLAALPGVFGINQVANELQVVLGPGKATAVATAFNALLQAQPAEPAVPTPSSVSDLAAQAQVGDGKQLHQAIRAQNATPAKLLLKKIANIFVPIIPGFIGCGLITGIINILLKLEPSLAQNSTIELLAVAGNAVFWGLNLFVGINAAKEFGGSPILGGIMAAILTHPGLAQVTLWGNSLVPGRGGIIAVVLIAAFTALLEKRLHKLIPELFDLFLTPLLVVLISTFVALGICQPLGGFLSETIGFAATQAISSGGAITGFILGGSFLPMVMVGVHQGLTPIHAELLSRSGVTILLPILAMAGAGQVGAALAVYFKTKNHQLRKTIASALPVGFMGIGEPLIYGVTLPLGKPFIGACIGGAFGGAIQASGMVGASVLGLSGLPLAASTNNVTLYLTGLVIAYVTGFIATYLIGFEDPQ